MNNIRNSGSKTSKPLINKSSHVDKLLCIDDDKNNNLTLERYNNEKKFLEEHKIIISTIIHIAV
jgi:hypothetical protein